MCVEAKRSALFSRGAFLAAAGAAAAPLFLEPAQGASLPLPPVPPGLSAPNARAAQIAHSSPFVRQKYAAAMQLAHSVGDAGVRADLLDLLANPVPAYARKYPTQQSREELREALAREGFVKPGAPVTGIFPPGTGGTNIVQPFWSAPGSAVDSHHSYPGGLLVHELFNASMAGQFERTYDAVYFGGRPVVDRDMVIAAAFYHDIMKTVVFQFNDDGTLLAEQDIAGTGGHHCLSGAEAIARGRDARFVTVLLSAHAAPSLGDEEKVVAWCRASALIAGVDPVEYGLLRKTASGFELASPAPIEAFVNHLSDHDYVLTIPAVRDVLPYIAQVDSSPWFRHRVLSRTPAIALYAELTRSENSLRRAIREAGE